MKTHILLLITLLLTIQYGAEAQSEPEIIWHTPGVSADFLVLSPDGQYVYANRGDSKLGNVFSQLRVDDGTIIRKDVNTVGHIAGFTADGRHAIVVNLRTIKNGNKIYKVETETLEKVDSLVFPDITYFVTAFAFSYDNKYLYLGNEGSSSQSGKRNNFHVVDIEQFEVVYTAIFVRQVPKADFAIGEILGIYPSPDNSFVALNVKADIGEVLGSWLPVLDVRDNYKNIVTNPPIEFNPSIGIGSVSYHFKGQLLCINERTYPDDILHIYNMKDLTLIEKFIFKKSSDGAGGLGSIVSSKVNDSIVFMGTAFRKEQHSLNTTKIAKVNIFSKIEECYIETTPDNEYRFGINSFLLFENDKHILSRTTVGSIAMFKNCTTTSIQDDKNTIQTLQVIDNKLTIPIEKSKGIMLNYQISDIRGVVNQKSIILTSNELTIDVHHLVPGTYFLTLQIADDARSYKFLLVR
jgi:hypothetical protein